MTLYAFDAIDDALSATRAFLWPFDLGRWARLALVMFFVGGGGGNLFQGNFGGTGGGGGGGGVPSGPGAPDLTPSLGGVDLAVLGVVLGAVFLIVLVFLLIGSIFEFVFVESLRREEVTIRRYWGERWGQGLRLAGFRIGLGVISLAVLLPILYVFLRPVIDDPTLVRVVGAVVLALLAFSPFGIVIGLANGFTTVFVVPVMIVEDRGVIAAWRLFWPTLREQWRQYAVYAVMGLVLQLAAGFLTLFAVVFLLLAMLLVFGTIALFGFLLTLVAGPLGLVVILLAALLGGLTSFVGGLFIQVPIQTYLRYYALFVLGDTAEEFDLIAERRAAVREDGVGG